MRVNKPKAPERSVRYLLYADQRLQRLSLRKISSRAKKPKKRPRSVQPKKITRAIDVVRFPWATDRRAIAAAVTVWVMCVVAAAALLAAHQPVHRADVASMGAAPDANVPPVEEVVAPRPEPKEAAVSVVPTPHPTEARATIATIKTYTAAALMEATPKAGAPKAMPSEPTWTAPERAPTPKATGVESAPKADVQNVALVTITGCLQRDEEAFWLNDTSGVEAPKSRSWKSGFLKKRPSSIELVGAADGLKLPSHVGQRVAATGTLTNREMRARSLRLVTASCS